MDASSSIIAFLLLLFSGFFPHHTSAGTPEKEAQDIVDRLFRAAGHLNAAKPLVMVTDENRRVAAYFPARNAIVLDQKAYDICRSYGNDFRHALAFILAHELTHSFQTEVRKRKGSTNFLSYDHEYKATTRIEKVADIQGAFTAYLAGYRPEKVVESLLPKMYEAYGLPMDGEIPGYPSLGERTNTTKEVMEISQLLIDLFETGNYLFATGNYQPAIHNFEYILQYYQGREIYNNLGVLYVLAGMEFFNPVTDRFSYPLEVDATTQLEKIKKSRGEVKLSEGDRMIRTRLLKKALHAFRQSLEYDNGYHTARLNHACALILFEKPGEALDYLKQQMPAPGKDTRHEDKLRMIRAIAYALEGDGVTAQSLLYDLTDSPDRLLALQAGFNADILAEKEQILLTGRTYELPDQLMSLVSSIRMQRISHLDPTPLTDDGRFVRIRKENSTSTFSFGDEQGSVISIIRFRNELASGLTLEATAHPDRVFFSNVIPATDGYFIKSTGNDVLVKIGSDDSVQEIIRIIYHVKN